MTTNEISFYAAVANAGYMITPAIVHQFRNRIPTKYIIRLVAMDCESRENKVKDILSKVPAL